VKGKPMKRTRPGVPAGRGHGGVVAAATKPSLSPGIRPQDAADLLRIRCPLRPTLGILLGSGFHYAVSELKTCLEMPYEELPGFLPTTIRGHAGRLLAGYLGATPVVLLSGRAHFYEGHSLERITFPVRALAAFGVRDLLFTNAAGAISARLRPGDFMVITDHINLMGANPLRGAAELDRERFVDLTRAYDADLSALLNAAGEQCGLRLQAGVYLAVSGPSYETPAEIRAFATLGADAVGMSTVPEVIVARQCGLRVLALSCITNLAAGLGPDALRHGDVLDTAERVKTTGTLLLKNFANLYGRRQNSRARRGGGQGA
jgi:purine-nucleoside phosphorylase